MLGDYDVCKRCNARTIIANNEQICDECKEDKYKEENL